MDTIDTQVWGKKDYETCMTLRQQMLQAYAAIPKAAREQHWLNGDVPANQSAKYKSRNWLKSCIGRLRQLRAA